MTKVTKSQNKQYRSLKHLLSMFIKCVSFSKSLSHVKTMLFSRLALSEQIDQASVQQTEVLAEEGAGVVVRGVDTLAHMRITCRDHAGEQCLG